MSGVRFENGHEKEKCMSCESIRNRYSTKRWWVNTLIIYSQGGGGRNYRQSKMVGEITDNQKWWERLQTIKNGQAGIWDMGKLDGKNMFCQNQSVR